jgi:hypothetical protein
MRRKRMSKPNMSCGECPYWLAYGEPETTDEQNRAIEEYCAECDACDGRCLNCDYFDPYKGECSREEYSEAREYLDDMIRAAKAQKILHKAKQEE